MMSENCTITPIPPLTTDGPNLFLGGCAGEAEGAASSWLQAEQVFNERVYARLCRNTIDAAELSSEDAAIILMIFQSLEPIP
jgi:hypothetical protein